MQANLASTKNKLARRYLHANNHQRNRNPRSISEFRPPDLNTLQRDKDHLQPFINLPSELEIFSCSKSNKESILERRFHAQRGSQDHRQRVIF